AVALVVNVVWIGRHLDWLRPLEAGRPAPSFDLPVLVAGTAGAGPAPGAARVRDVDLRGKVVVLDFWATWCKPCLIALPRLDAAARVWGDQVAAIAVNLDDRDKAIDVYKDARWQLTLAADDGDASTRYQVEMLPHVVVIDARGIVRFVGQGAGGARNAEAAVERLLAGE
ncbi:MAG TPA: TlpA disulfide reductase family protein, partial [Kofleriaceae bacterium]|nr:TlpA disulfide reductase family protein [Kofleriaceae bacterium]